MRYMNLGGRLRAMFGMRPAGFTEPERLQFSGPIMPVDQLLLYAESRVGNIDRARALQVPAVLRGRNMICSVGTLPLELIDDENRVQDHPLFAQIDHNVANPIMMAMTLEDLLFDAIAWWRIVEFDALGYPAKAVRYAPQLVTLQPPEDYQRGSLPSGSVPVGTVWMDGQPVPPYEVIRFDSPNPPLLVAGERAIRRAIVLDEAADLYAKSPKMRGFFTPRDPNADPGDSGKIVAALDAFATARRERLDGYVPSSLVYNPVQDPTPAELQLLQMAQRADLQIANAIGLDPEELGINTTSRTYQNDVDRRKDKINDVLSPYMVAITARLSMPDVTLPGRVARFKLDDYLKADPFTRAQVQQIYLANGVIDTAEVRQDEGRTPRALPRLPRPAVPQSQISAIPAGAR
jgi:portal protein